MLRFDYIWSIYVHINRYIVIENMNHSRNSLPTKPNFFYLLLLLYLKLKNSIAAQSIETYILWNIIYQRNFHRHNEIRRNFFIGTLKRPHCNHRAWLLLNASSILKPTLKRPKFKEYYKVLFPFIAVIIVGNTNSKLVI